MSRSSKENQMGVFDTMYNCRAMRRLDSRAVPEELLCELVSAANQAPSGSNTQGARWIVVTDAEVRRRLADLNRQGVETYLAPLIKNQVAYRTRAAISVSAWSTLWYGKKNICTKFRR